MTPSENVLAIAQDLRAAIERVEFWAVDYGGMRFLHYVVTGYIRRQNEKSSASSDTKHVS